MALLQQLLSALRVALGKVREPRDQRKILLLIDGRPQLRPGHTIEFDHKAGVNVDLWVVVKGGA